MSTPAGSTVPKRGSLSGLLLIGMMLTWVAAPAAAEVVAVTYHPFPDSADPLGFPFAGGRDAFIARHGHRFDGIPPYPYIVVDGVREVVGIPDPQDPMESTRSAVVAAIDARDAEPAAAGLGLATAFRDGAVDATVDVTPVEPLGRGQLWVALLEDPVHFRPPQAVSNGVFDHRNTLRAIARFDTALDGPSGHNASFDVDPAWDVDRLLVVAWVQASADPVRFAPHEVLQAVQTDVGSSGHADATTRNVLLEMLSATWCDTCLYGDTVAAEVAGLAPRTRDAGYAALPPWGAWLAAGVAALAVASWRVRGGTK